MGELRTLGREGDIKLVWDPDNEVDVAAAKAAFDKAKAKGFFAYGVKDKGGKGTVINTFDADAEKIILALPMAGG